MRLKLREYKMQNKKYRIDYTQKIEEFGRTLYRIVALADFGSVTTGDQGGYIESEKNLSQSGNAWVYDNAKVYGNARVYGNAKVYGNARVYDNAKVYDNAIVYGNAEVTKLCITVRTRKYYCTILDTHMVIGCKNYTFSEWKNFDDETISKMDSGASEWWTQWKPILFEILKVENKIQV